MESDARQLGRLEALRRRGVVVAVMAPTIVLPVVLSTYLLLFCPGVFAPCHLLQGAFLGLCIGVANWWWSGRQIGRLRGRR